MALLAGGEQSDIGTRLIVHFRSNLPDALSTNVLDTFVNPDVRK